MATQNAGQTATAYKEQTGNRVVETLASSISEMLPIHGDLRETKVSLLVESIGNIGWEGPPIVCAGGALITGCHRQEALRRLGNDNYALTGRTVSPQDVFEISEDEVLDFISLDDIVGLSQTLRALDPGLAEYLGIDCH